MSLWYAGYGSNLDRDRFLLYLRGGRPSGATWSAPGARDATEPTDERAMTLPGAVLFGGESRTWGGGVAFLDPEAPGVAYARAYRITQAQFVDVAAQEMHQPPGADLDLTTVLEQRRHDLGPGLYESLHLVGELDGEPVLTFTTPDPGAVPRTTPSAAYLAVVARGLATTHDLEPSAIADYLAGLSGVAPWTAPQIADLIRPTE